MQEFVNQVIMPVLQALLTALIATAVGYLLTFIKSKKAEVILKANKIEDETARTAALAAIDSIDNVLTTNIIGMQSVADKIKSADLSKEDRDKQLADLAANVKSMVLEQLSDSIKKQSEVVISDLDGYITARLEKNLEDVKTQMAFNNTELQYCEPSDNAIKIGTTEPEVVLLNQTTNGIDTPETKIDNITK